MSSALESERDSLRTQYESLYEQRLAITNQMKEIEERLQSLDEEIDRVNQGGDNTVAVRSSGETEDANADVRFEVVEGDGESNNSQNRKRPHEDNSGSSNNRGPPMSLTHPEEYLTDPRGDDGEMMLMTQQETNHHNDATSLPPPPKKTRRISTSPPFGSLNNNDNSASNNTAGIFKSSTPPGLKCSSRKSNMSSLNNANIDDEIVDEVGRSESWDVSRNNPLHQNLNQNEEEDVVNLVDSQDENGVRSSNNGSSRWGGGNNPFQDLWSASDGGNGIHQDSQQQHNNQNIAAASSLARRGGSSGGSNTLEKYFGRSQSSLSNNAQQMQQPSRIQANFPNPYNKNRSTRSNQSSSTDNNTSSNNNINPTNYPWTNQMMHHLRQTFKISNFRGHQQEIINATLSGQDVFVIMRTGGGKSLTYQLPAVLESQSNMKKVTVVISPLISLIHDQEEQMNEFLPGSALSFTSGLAGGNSEHARRWNIVRDPNGGVALIFVTPEKVSQSGKFRGEMQKLYDQKRLGRFVIDECHCACQWGHDFRPDYTKLGLLKNHFPTIPVLAVTATASERVRHDCAQILRLGSNYRFFRSTANRPNLRYSIRRKHDTKEEVVKDMVAFIKNNHCNQAGIIYTFSRKEADELADKLCDRGIIARSYHSSVTDTRKEAIHRSWMRNQTQIVVATIAFGLGINKPDVRFVLHHSISKSLEAYYQESGRAGRDGNPADCVLYYSPKDVSRLLSMVHGEAGEATFWGMVRYGQGHGDDAVCRETILRTLGEVNRPGDDVLARLQEQCKTTEARSVGAHCKTVVQLVSTLNHLEESCTLNQVVTKWRSKGDYDFLKDNPPNKDLTKEECERLIVSLLVEDVLHPDMVYTQHTTICYLKLGPRGSAMLSSADPKVSMRFPKRETKSQTSTTRAAQKHISPLKDEEGWIDRKMPAKKNTKTTKARATKATSKPKAKSTTAAKSTTKSKKRTSAAGQKKTATQKANTREIVELDSSSSSSEDELIIARSTAAKNRKSVSRMKFDESSSDEECEFD